MSWNSKKKLEGTILGTYQLIFAIFFIKVVPNITCVLLWEFLPKDTMSNVIHQEMKVKLPLFYKNKKTTCKKNWLPKLNKNIFCSISCRRFIRVAVAETKFRKKAQKPWTHSTHLHDWTQSWNVPHSGAHILVQPVVWHGGGGGAWTSWLQAALVGLA